jgi:dihydroneopterin triphosphate diphosphatase
MYKLPHSVQVVVFANTPEGREYLLLKRVPSHGGFWQTVTGSLEPGETHVEAAVREVAEETGFRVVPASLIDLNLNNRFLIAPQWLAKYAPGVTHNEERCFAFACKKEDPTLDTREHVAYQWTSYQTAVSVVYWESTRMALEATEAVTL